LKVRMLNLIIDETCFIGMNRQISSQIALLIRKNVLKAGESLPGEALLAGQHNVSRSVVREAYQILKDKKLICSNRSYWRVVENPSKVGFHEYMKIQLPANLKEKLDVITLLQDIDPNKFIEQELTDKVEILFTSFCKLYQTVKPAAPD
jgi:DNA-binding transcriptional regulator YhcF (GntR family)